MLSLADLRTSQGHDVYEMAAYLGIEVRDYVRIESDPDLMSIQQAKMLCHLFHCGIDELFPVTVRAGA